MAYILPGDFLLTKAASTTLSYPQLAALRQRALSGDASAAIALAQLPDADQRLAKMLVDNFSGKASKPGKPRRKAVQAAPAKPDLEDFLTRHLNSPNPQIRALAESALKSIRQAP